MPALGDSFPAIVQALGERYGRPSVEAPGAADSPFRSILAVALERITDPRKVAAALERLSDLDLLEPESLAAAHPLEIADPLRESGIASPSKAAASLRRLAQWLVEHHAGAGESLLDEAGCPTGQLREELLAINGIGQATADAILLFALRRPVYPVDRATYRILVRHGWLDTAADYDEARDTLERHAEEDPRLLARLSTWMEQLGRDYCRASVAKCDRCPLRGLLPEGGPVTDG